MLCAGWAPCRPAKFAAATPTSSSTNWSPPHTANIRRVGFRRRCGGVISCSASEEEPDTACCQREREREGELPLVERVLPLQTVNVEHKEKTKRRLDLLLEVVTRGKGWKHTLRFGVSSRAPKFNQHREKVLISLPQRCENSAQGTAVSKRSSSPLLIFTPKR